MTAVTVNVPLLRKTLEHIEAHPEEWDQSSWSCGTSGCFAYHAAMISGGEPVDMYLGYVVSEEDDPSDQVYLAAIGRPAMVHVATRAVRVLGLDEHPGDTRLFNGDNTLDDLRRIVAELSGDGAS